jgi:hypothetical protein
MADRDSLGSIAVQILGRDRPRQRGGDGGTHRPGDRVGVVGLLHRHDPGEQVELVGLDGLAADGLVGCSLAADGQFRNVRAGVRRLRRVVDEAVPRTGGAPDPFEPLQQVGVGVDLLRESSHVQADLSGTREDTRAGDVDERNLDTADAFDRQRLGSLACREDLTGD